MITAKFGLVLESRLARKTGKVILLPVCSTIKGNIKLFQAVKKVNTIPEIIGLINP